MKLIATTLFSLTLLFPSFSQNCEGPASEIIVSTGYNPVSASILGSLDFDPMWRLIQAPADPVGWTSNIGGPAIVVPTSGSWNLAGTHSMYINAFPTTQALTDNWGVTTPAYIFQREFCICTTSPTGMADVTFELALNADNWAELYLEDEFGNSSLLMAQPYVYSTNNFTGSPDLLDTTFQLLEGTYKLKLHHRNKLVVMGVNLDGKIYSNGLLSDNTCTRRGAIAGFTKEDTNQNLLEDGGDQAVHGWNIDLFDDQQNLLATTTSDHSGYFFFMDLDEGDYVVKTQPQTGYYVILPNSTEHLVHVDTNVVNKTNFLIGAGEAGLTDLTTVDYLFTLFPNPNNGTFKIEFIGNETATKLVRILDQSGRILKVLSTEESEISVDLEKYTSGIYYVEVSSATSVQMKKVSIR
ncbi:MAG: T9SS type A sorting domain-containing protein [Crocinitomicaceae bacterium]|nr:T9SS type A sorting domain-containing protein [Crocinitomicaceae bacterium]